MLLVRILRPSDRCWFCRDYRPLRFLEGLVAARFPKQALGDFQTLFRWKVEAAACQLFANPLVGFEELARAWPAERPAAVLTERPAAVLTGRLSRRWCQVLFANPLVGFEVNKAVTVSFEILNTMPSVAIEKQKLFRNVHCNLIFRFAACFHRPFCLVVISPIVELSTFEITKCLDE